MDPRTRRAVTLGALGGLLVLLAVVRLLQHH